MTSDREEPMIVSLMRRTPTGEVRYIAKPGERGMIGTSTHGFLSELDAWLSSVRREAAAEALEEAAHDLNTHFQDLPSWADAYRAGERSDDWMKGATRMVTDAIARLRSRAAEIREGDTDPTQDARAEAWDAGRMAWQKYVWRREDADAAGQGVILSEPLNPYRQEAGQ